MFGFRGGMLVFDKYLWGLIAEFCPATVDLVAQNPRRYIRFVEKK